jgi:hypothetical protein
MPTKHSDLGPTAEVGSCRIPICSTLARLTLTTLLAGVPGHVVAQNAHSDGAPQRERAK